MRGRGDNAHSFLVRALPVERQANLLADDMACFLWNPVFRPWDEWAMPGLSDRIVAPMSYTQNYCPYISLSDCCLSIYLLN